MRTGQRGGPALQNMRCPSRGPQPDSQQPHEVLTTVTSHSPVTQLRDQTPRSGLCRLLHLRVHIVHIDTQSKIKSKRNTTEMYNIECKLSGMVLNFTFFNVLCVCMMMEMQGPQFAFGGPRTTVELVLFFHRYQVSRDETQVTRLLQAWPSLAEARSRVGLKHKLQAQSFPASSSAALARQGCPGQCPRLAFSEP